MRVREYRYSSCLAIACLVCLACESGEPGEPGGLPSAGDGGASASGGFAGDVQGSAGDGGGAAHGSGGNDGGSGNSGGTTSSPLVPEWIRRFGALVSNVNSSYIDEEGNVVFGATVEGPIDLGTGVLEEGAWFTEMIEPHGRGLIAKLGPDGQTIWAKRFGGAHPLVSPLPGGEIAVLMASSGVDAFDPEEPPGDGFCVGRLTADGEVGWQSCSEIVSGRFRFHVGAAQSLATTEQGLILIAGRFEGQVMLPGPELFASGELTAPDTAWPSFAAVYAQNPLDASGDYVLAGVHVLRTAAPEPSQEETNIRRILPYAGGERAAFLTGLAGFGTIGCQSLASTDPYNWDEYFLELPLDSTPMPGDPEALCNSQLWNGTCNLGATCTPPPLIPGLTVNDSVGWTIAGLPGESLILHGYTMMGPIDLGGGVLQPMNQNSSGTARTVFLAKWSDIRRESHVWSRSLSSGPTAIAGPVGERALMVSLESSGPGFAGDSLPPEFDSDIENSGPAVALFDETGELVGRPVYSAFGVGQSDRFVVTSLSAARDERFVLGGYASGESIRFGIPVTTPPDANFGDLWISKWRAE